MKNKETKSDNIKWFIEVFILTFILSLFFSFLSAKGVSNLSLVPAIIILLITIFIGIVFDIIGVAVTVANEEELHAMASKKVKGSKKAIKLVKNGSKVANICADVIGEICGVLSGAIGALIALKVSEMFSLPDNNQVFISAAVASLTVSGKALGKGFAKKNSTSIVHKVGIILSVFQKRDK